MGIHAFAISSVEKIKEQSIERKYVNSMETALATVLGNKGNITTHRDINQGPR